MENIVSELKLRIKISKHHVFVFVAVVAYLFLSLEDKGSILGSGGALFEFFIRFFIGFPLAFIDIIPIIFASIIIVALIFDKSLKVIWAVFLPFILISHGIYFLIAMVGYSLSWQLVVSTLIFVVLTLYIITYSVLSKGTDYYEIDLKVAFSKYNTFIKVVLMIITFLLLIPVTGTSDLVSSSSNGYDSGFFVRLFSNGSIFLNLTAYLIRLPLVIIILTEIFKLRTSLINLSKVIYVYGMIVSGITYYLLNKLGIDSLIEVSRANIYLMFLLVLWAIFETTLVREAEQLKLIIDEETRIEYDKYFEITEISNFSWAKIEMSISKIPLFGKNIIKKFSQSGTIEFIKVEIVEGDFTEAILPEIKADDLQTSIITDRIEEEIVAEAVITKAYNPNSPYTPYRPVERKIKDASTINTVDITEVIARQITIIKEILNKTVSRLKVLFDKTTSYIKGNKKVLVIFPAVIIMVVIVSKVLSVNAIKQDYISNRNNASEIENFDIIQVDKIGSEKVVEIGSKEISNNMEVNKNVKMLYAKEGLFWEFDSMETPNIIDRNVIYRINDELLMEALSKKIQKDVLITDESLTQVIEEIETKASTINVSLENEIKQNKAILNKNSEVVMDYSILEYDIHKDFASANISIITTIKGKKYTGIVHDDIEFKFEEGIWHYSDSKVNPSIRIIPNEPINEAELKVLLKDSNLSDKDIDALKIISNEVVTNDSNTYELSIDIEMIDGLGTFVSEILVFNLKVYFEDGEWRLSGYEEVSSQVIKNEDMFREYTGLYYMNRDNVDRDIFVSGLAFTLDIQDVDYDGNLVGYINLESYEDMDYVSMRSFNVTIDLDEPQNSFISNPEFQIQKEVISFFLAINKSLDVRVNIQDIKFDAIENKFYGELEVSGHILRGDGVRSDTLIFEAR